MNKLIFDEMGNLHITKSNGLRYEITQCDKPNLGFDYDFLVYDDDEFKIVSLDPDKDIGSQLREPLSDTEKDAIEDYIKSSVPPAGYNLNQQYVHDIKNTCYEYSDQMLHSNNFENLTEALYAAREGSNHPHRGVARQCLEFSDACWSQFEMVSNQIQQTREDNLNTFDYYRASIPYPDPS